MALAWFIAYANTSPISDGTGVRYAYFMLILVSWLYVVRHHESHIMSEKKYFSFWQIWILHMLNFKSIYNLPYFIVRKMQQKSDRKLESCMAQFSCPSVFLNFWAFMISDFIRVTWWRTTYITHWFETFRRKISPLCVPSKQITGSEFVYAMNHAHIWDHNLHKAITWVTHIIISLSNTEKNMTWTVIPDEQVDRVTCSKNYKYIMHDVCLLEITC